MMDSIFDTILNASDDKIPSFQEKKSETILYQMFCIPVMLLNSLPLSSFNNDLQQISDLVFKCFGDTKNHFSFICMFDQNIFTIRFSNN